MNRMGIALMVWIGIVLAGAAESGGKTGESMAKETIRMTVGETVFVVKLETTAAADELKKRLPLTISMKELNHNEKYFTLSRPLPTAATVPGQVRRGELMLFGSSTVVLFYESFTTSYSYTRLGRVDDPAELKKALGKGDVNVTFGLEINR